MKKALLILISLSLVSCASHRTLTREEWLQVGKKEFTNIKKEDLIKNAEKLLTLMDGRDVKFSYTQNGFVASRNWLIYVVVAAAVGTDYWTFDVQEKDNKLIASIQPSTMAGTVSGYAVGGQVSTITTPTIGTPIQGTAIYNMFWNRLDYLLGKTDQWMDCKQGLSKINKNETWGNLEHICDSVTIDDNYPENLSDAEIERIFKNDYNGKSQYFKKSRPELYAKIKSAYQ